MTESRHKKLHNLIVENEDWLMANILHHAIERGYAAYTSTLVEPWRLSICGLSQPLLATLANKRESLELAPDEDYTQDAIAAFGILEAKRHRQRGISIAMFMGLFKYYRQSYVDLLDKASFMADEKSGPIIICTASLIVSNWAYAANGQEALMQKNSRIAVE